MFRITAWLRRLFPAFFGGAVALRADELTITLSPSSGPPTTTVTIRVSGADAGDQVRVLVREGGRTAGVAGSPKDADANGEATFTDRFAMGFSPGETLEVAAESGSSAIRKGTAEFEVTGEKEPV